MEEGKEKKEWKGKFHCSMEVKVKGGAKKGNNKGKSLKESGWGGGTEGV